MATFSPLKDPSEHILGRNWAWRKKESEVIVDMKGEGI